jgi:hypothetical protein
MSSVDADTGIRYRKPQPVGLVPASLGRSGWRATLGAMEPARVTLSGDLSGDYLVEERRPDGRVVLRPDLSVKAMLSCHDVRELTPEEFDQHFGELPTDGEG